jgi:hypothetical protein
MKSTSIKPLASPVANQSQSKLRVQCRRTFKRGRMITFRQAYNTWLYCAYKHTFHPNSFFLQGRYVLDQ